MSSIATATEVSIAQLADSFKDKFHNPELLKRALLSTLNDVSAGEANIVLPTNPTVFLLDAAIAATRAAVDENLLLMQRMYPNISTTEDELYPHMSDKDYLDRFAQPATGKFIFLIQYQSLKSNMVKDDINGCMRARIASNTSITVNDTTFTLQYPIDFMLYDGGVLVISYDGDRVSPIQNLTTNIIDKEIVRDANGTEWVRFSIDVLQVRMNNYHYALDSSRVFKETVSITNDFYYARVYYQDTPLSEWVEINTTHTDQVYSPLTPTAVLKVVEKEVTIYIPNIYIESNKLTGTLRVDIFETKGSISMDLSTFKIGSYVVEKTTYDNDTANIEYRSAMNNISYIVYSQEYITGGSKKLSFEELRNRYTSNSIDVSEQVITPNQLSAKISRGFEIIKNVDTITNRIYIASKDLPDPDNKKLVLPANISINTLNTKTNILKEHPRTRDNGDRLTITSSMLYKNTNGILETISEADLIQYGNMQPALLAETINNLNVFYSPYYYVLDSSDNEFELRAYHLDNPNIKYISFIDQNILSGLQVNTDGYSISVTSTGFRLDIAVKSDSVYKQLPDANVSAQLGIIGVGEDIACYLTGTLLGKNAAGERVFRFDIKSDFDIDNNDNIAFTNFQVDPNQALEVFFNLSTKVSLFYTTDAMPANYTTQTMDNLLGKDLLPINSIAITHEVLAVEFGKPLKNLWTQTRSSISGGVYKTYSADVPKTYLEDTYDKDPITGSIFTVSNGELIYNTLHRKGEVVLDGNGQVVLLHRKGEVVFENGEPVKISSGEITRHIDLFLVDGIYYFTNDRSYVEYRTTVANMIGSWINNELESIKSVLLEKTNIYFYPRKNIGTATVSLGNGITTTIESKQSLVLDVHYKSGIKRDDAIEENIRFTAAQLINSYLGKRVIIIKDIEEALSNMFSDNVSSIKVSGLGGSNNNFEVVKLDNEHEKLAIRNKLFSQEDGSLITKEDLTFNFLVY